jgi:epoxyqueuosine reductase QueG
VSDLTNDFRAFANAQADVVGIAPVSRFEKAPAGYRPNDILSSATNVVVIGVQMLGLESGHVHVMQGNYWVTSAEAPRLAYYCAKWLRNKGYDVAPISPFLPLDMTKESGLRADFSHRHAAVEAGLGEIGLNNLLITPQYGPRVRLASIITNAPLEADPRFEQTVCLGEDCNLCIKKCPVEAFTPSGETDKRKCLRHTLKYGYGSFLRSLRGLLQTEKDKVPELLRDPALPEFFQFLEMSGAAECFECIRVCPIGKKRKVKDQSG